MKVLALQQAIVETKFRFSLLVLVLAAVIAIGSFYLVGYLRFSIERQSLFLSSLRYRAEYISEQQGVDILAAAGSAFTPLSSLYAAGGTAEGVPVLTYHSILATKDATATAATSSFEGANVSLENFKDQMFALKAAGWQTVSYAEFEAYIRGQRTLPEKSFLITFDDGAKNSFYPAEPILEAMGFGAVAFILPSHSLGDRSSYYLNRNEVEFMKSTGHWDIESHGQNIHVSLPSNASGTVKNNALSNRAWLTGENRLETHEEYVERIGRDLIDAKRNLENAFGGKVSAFAFPFGDFGQNGSNDPDAEDTVLALAKQHYSLAFYQNWNRGDFTFNYPSPDAFLIKRIPVGPEWDGEKLLSILESSEPKALPYSTASSSVVSWRSNWGEMDTAGGALRLFAAPDTTGALAVLDGSLSWKDYQVDADVEWDHGYVMVLFDMQNPNEGRACVFSSTGNVQLQERTKDDIFILREVKLKKFSAGAHTLGAVSSGTTAACVLDGTYVIDATLEQGSGGVGLEAWNEEQGTAEAFIKGVSARKKK